MQVEDAARLEVWVVGDGHDVAAARGEVVLELEDVDDAAAAAHRGDGDDRLAREVLEPVRLEPVEGGAGAACSVEAGRAHHDERVRKAEDAVHRTVQQAGAAVGQDEVVEPLQRVDRVAVVLLAEGERGAGVGVRGQHLEPGRRLVGERAHVGVALQLGARVEQVAHRRARLTGHALAERPAVGVGVDGDDTVAAQLGEHRAQGRGGRRLPDAALETDHGESMASLDRRTCEDCPFVAFPVGGRRAEIHPTVGHREDAAPPARAGPVGVLLEDRVRGQ